MRRPRLLSAVLALLVSLGVMIGTSVPAEAATWHSYFPSNSGCGTFYTDVCWIEYTSGYPGGLVRAGAGKNQYEVLLQSQAAVGGSWVTVAVTYPGTSHTGYTPSWHVGKTNSYRACERTLSFYAISCSSAGGIYLGD